MGGVRDKQSCRFRPGVDDLHESHASSLFKKFLEGNDDHFRSDLCALLRDGDDLVNQ